MHIAMGQRFCGLEDRELRIIVHENTNPRRAGGLSPNVADTRSSSALRNACVSWAVEFGGARRAEPEEGPQGADAAPNHLLSDGWRGLGFKIS